MADGAKTFVLVHGTWLGGWIWRDVRALLEADGHRVFTPTLTGCGERAHLMAPDIGLETHITDITAVLDWEELDDVILLGHSFSGIAITGAADRRRDRIRHLVYMDALVPRAGRMSGAWRDPQTGELTEKFQKRIPKFIDGYQMDYWAEYPLRMLLNEGHAEIDALVQRQVKPHPMRGWTDVLSLQNGGWEGLPRSYIRAAAQDFAPSSDDMPGPAKDNPDWTWLDLPIDRLGMLTAPETVAGALRLIA